MDYKIKNIDKVNINYAKALHKKTTNIKIIILILVILSIIVSIWTFSLGIKLFLTFLVFLGINWLIHTACLEIIKSYNKTQIDKTKSPSEKLKKSKSDNESNKK